VPPHDSNLHMCLNDTRALCQGLANAAHSCQLLSCTPVAVQPPPVLCISRGKTTPQCRCWSGSSCTPHVSDTVTALLQIGLQGYGSMPDALAVLGPAERATYCNDTWQKTMPRMSTLEFTRDRKMMSTLTTGRRGAVLYLKVCPHVTGP